MNKENDEFVDYGDATQQGGNNSSTNDEFLTFLEENTKGDFRILTDYTKGEK